VSLANIWQMRVWFNGRTSAFQADGAGSIPATRSKLVNFGSYSSVGRAHPW
jgi:hypothetical protein